MLQARRHTLKEPLEPCCCVLLLDCCGTKPGCCGVAALPATVWEHLAAAELPATHAG